MIQVKNATTGEIRNATSMTGYEDDPEWSKVADLPAGAAEPSLYGAGGAEPGTENLALVKLTLIAAVKAEAEAAKMAVLTNGDAKMMEYADKSAEVRAYHTLGGSLTAIVAALGATTGQKMKATFPYSLADAAARGDTLPDAIARFAAGIAAATTVPAMAAKESHLCDAIRGATSSTAARSLYNARSW